MSTNKIDNKLAGVAIAGAVNNMLALVNGYPDEERHSIAITAAIALQRQVLLSHPHPLVAFELIVVGAVDGMKERTRKRSNSHPAPEQDHA
jgi:hypothetical protein